MFTFEGRKGYFFSTLSIPDAMRRFAMTKAEVVGIINKADGAAPGRYEGCMRATVLTMLLAAVERKGGLE